jgi:CheY-like chemotaxis protein
LLSQLYAKPIAFGTAISTRHLPAAIPVSSLPSFIFSLGNPIPAADSPSMARVLKWQENWHGICAGMTMMKMRTGRQRHILIVDDESLVRQSVQMLLQGDGYLVHAAKSGAEALALFEPGKFDMIFTDYLMPEMRGDQLAAAIKQQSPRQPVVMITAFPEKLQSSDCPLGGVDSFICKPFELDTLRSAIARYAPA